MQVTFESSFFQMSWAKNTFLNLLGLMQDWIFKLGKAPSNFWISRFFY